MQGNYDHTHVLDSIDTDTTCRLLCGQNELVETVAPQLRDTHLDGLDLE